MKLATFTQASRTRIGLVVEDEIIDLAVAAPDLPTDMVAFLEAGDAALARARKALGAAQRIPLQSVKLEMPVLRPPLCMHGGLNYKDHIEKSNHGWSTEISGNIKTWSAMTGPYDPILKPRISDELDYELEFSMVIGKPCRGVAKAEAHKYVVGYMIVNDGGLRDWLPPKRGRSGAIGKNFDRTSPMGPWIVTPDELGNPHTLAIRTWVNSEIRQDANTRNMIFDCFDHVHTFATAMTLAPGTIITTGTPFGTAQEQDPPNYLKVGDVVRMEVEGIGHLENTVVAE